VRFKRLDYDAYPESIIEDPTATKLDFIPLSLHFYDLYFTFSVTYNFIKGCL